MAISKREEVGNALFNALELTESEKIERQLLLEQYKIMVDTSESLVGRRLLAHNFFLAINTAIISGFGLALREFLLPGDTGASNGLLIIVTITFIGIGLLLAWTWERLLKSFGQLNSGKFVVIELLEKKLPCSIFEAEWVALGAGKDPKKYTPFTKTEKALPRVFGFVYLAIGVLALGMKLL